MKVHCCDYTSSDAAKIWKSMTDVALLSGLTLAGWFLVGVQRKPDRKSEESQGQQDSFYACFTHVGCMQSLINYVYWWLSLQ